MTCPACTRAQHNPASGIYQSNCINCEARALAQSPEAHRRESDPSAIQAAMRKTWPNVEQYRYGRTLVWGWIQKLEKVSNG